MLIHIDKLFYNADNPRTISGYQLNKLTQSILLFPDMLKIRDIIVNKDNIILAGNQRVQALHNIIDLDLTPEHAMGTAKYAKLSAEELDILFDHWEQFKKNPIVEVTVADISLDRQKEILIKDNNEYGEFDTDILQRAFSREDLVDYGIDENILWDKDAEEALSLAEMPKTDNETASADNDATETKEADKGNNLVNLQCAGRKLRVSETEYNMILEKFNDYVNAYGSTEGFVSSLINKEEEK